MSHICHARGCATEVPPKLFMCLKHWKQVPKYLQKEIWFHYRPGQEVDKKPTKEYLDVTDEAIEHVAKKEKKS